jgi:hypothetical protein
MLLQRTGPKYAMPIIVGVPGSNNQAVEDTLGSTGIGSRLSRKQASEAGR